MDILWQVIYLLIGVFVLVIIPFCTYYYESDPDWTFVSRIKIILVGKDQVFLVLSIRNNYCGGTDFNSCLFLPCSGNLEFVNF